MRKIMRKDHVNEVVTEFEGFRVNTDKKGEWRRKAESMEKRLMMKEKDNEKIIKKVDYMMDEMKRGEEERRKEKEKKKRKKRKELKK